VSTVAQVRVGGRGRRRISRATLDQTVVGYLCLSPLLLHFLIFLAFPLVFSLYLSLNSWDLMSPDKSFVGLGNYVQLFHDADFWQAAVNTVIFAFWRVVVGTILALLLALLVNQKLRGISIFRGAIFAPVITSLVAISVVWLWLYDPSYGLLNLPVKALGMAPLAWLQDPHLAMPAVIIMSIWKGVGYTMVIYLAGLQGIPEQFYEAARIDGAGAWARFRFVTLPLLTPVTLFVLVISTIGAFQIFAQIYIMTNGGPVKSTTVAVYYLYQQGFQFFHMGYASALAWILFLVMLILTVVQFRFFRQEVGL